MASVDGGGLIPIDLYGQAVIDALATANRRRASTCRSDNIVILRHGNMKIGRANTSATVNFIGEDAATEISTPQQSFGEVSLKVEKGDGAGSRRATPSSGSAETRPESSVSSSANCSTPMALQKISAFLRGLGSQWTPKGLRYSAATVNSATQASPSRRCSSDRTGLINALEAANVKMVSPVWFTSPQVIDYLRTAVSASSGDLMFKGIQDGKLLGWPIDRRRPFRRTWADSSNQSELYLCDMDEVLIGQGFVEVGVHPSGTYTDDNGDLQSAFDHDESILRLTACVDIGLKHDAACAVLTDVPWAAS